MLSPPAVLSAELQRYSDLYYGRGYTACRDPVFRADLQAGDSVMAGEDDGRRMEVDEGVRGGEEPPGESDPSEEVVPTERLYEECVGLLVVPLPDALKSVPFGAPDVVLRTHLTGLTFEARDALFFTLIRHMEALRCRQDALAKYACPNVCGWQMEQEPHVSGGPRALVARGIQAAENPELFAMLHATRAYGAFERAIVDNDHEVRASDGADQQRLPEPDSGRGAGKPAASFVKVTLPPQASFKGCAPGKVEGVHEIVQWAQEKKASAALANIPEGMQVAWASRYLTGDAAQWWQGLGKNSAPTFEALVKGLTLRFVGRTAYDLLIRDLQSKRLKDFGSIEEYLAWLERTLACLREFAGARMRPETVLVDDIVQHIDNTPYFEDVGVDPETGERPLTLARIRELLTARHDVLAHRSQAWGFESAPKRVRLEDRMMLLPAERPAGGRPNAADRPRGKDKTRQHNKGVPGNGRGAAGGQAANNLRGAHASRQSGGQGAGAAREGHSVKERRELARRLTHALHQSGAGELSLIEAERRIAAHLCVKCAGPQHEGGMSKCPSKAVVQPGTSAQGGQ